MATNTWQLHVQNWPLEDHPINYTEGNSYIRITWNIQKILNRFLLSWFLKHYYKKLFKNVTGSLLNRSVIRTYKYPNSITVIPYIFVHSLRIPRIHFGKANAHTYVPRKSIVISKCSGARSISKVRESSAFRRLQGVASRQREGMREEVGVLRLL